MNLIDDSKADEYLGKVILLGVTYLSHEHKLLGETQWVGTISTFSRKEGIRIAIKGSDEPCCLPPYQGGIRKAPRGIYRLGSAGGQIRNPDYLATRTCVTTEPVKRDV